MTLQYTNSERYSILPDSDPVTGRLVWHVVDTHVEDGVVDVPDADGGERWIVRREARHSSHTSVDEAIDAADAANAEEAGLTLEAYREVQREALIRLIAEDTGETVEQVRARLEQAQTE